MIFKYHKGDISSQIEGENLVVFDCDGEILASIKYAPGSYDSEFGFIAAIALQVANAGIQIGENHKAGEVARTLNKLPEGGAE